MAGLATPARPGKAGTAPFESHYALQKYIQQMLPHLLHYFWVPTGIRTQSGSSTGSCANRYTIGTV